MPDHEAKYLELATLLIADSNEANLKGREQELADQLKEVCEEWISDNKDEEATGD